MTTIPSSLVKQLRDKTNAGMLDCKKALQASNADLEKAVDWLRSKGLASAAKKFGRTASEGGIAIATQGQNGVIVEINTETDFAARNDHFQRLTTQIVSRYLQDSDADLPQLVIDGHSVTDLIRLLISTVGENIVLRRWRSLTLSQGVVGGYIHNALSPQIGRIGVLIAVESDATEDQVAPLAKRLAMHIAASQPEALTPADLDPRKLEREKAIVSEQAKASGKPAAVIDQIVQGRLRKFYEDVVLLEQSYVFEPERKVKEILDLKRKEFQASLTIKDFIHFKLGQ